MKMPCNQPQNYNIEYDYYDLQLLKIRSEQLDKLTAMLCEFLGKVENQSVLLTEDLKVWWEQHKKDDDQRLKLEAKEQFSKIEPYLSNKYTVQLILEHVDPL
jgi:hypothetical protein